MPSPRDGQLGHDELIDTLCDRYEAALRSGADPNILGFLSAAPEHLQGSLLKELLLVDIEYRSLSVDELPNDFYRKKLPGFASVIAKIDFDATARTLVGNELAELSDLPPVLGRFEMLERLGAGGMGQVWKARDKDLDRFVAIKTPRNMLLCPAERQRFMREGRAAAQLDHPNIVPVFEVSRDEKLPYIVSGYIDGPDLRRHVCERGLSVAQIVDLLVDVADAVHHAHEAGIIHRDVKPSNVLVDQHGVPYVTDFGLAKWRSQDLTVTPSLQVMGTPAYMSPEMARGQASSTNACTDVYSLGVMLYELVSGELPFPEESFSSVLLAVLAKEPRPLRSICRSAPRDLETICLKAMHKESARRYRTAADFADDLRRFQREESIVARRATIVEKSWRLVKRRPATAAALLSAMLALTAAAAAIGISAQRDRMAQENEELRGLRTVRIATEPPGARVAFVPLDQATGVPVPEGFRSLGQSPIEQKIEPGKYLVVAWKSDDEFHEVVRYVPDSQDPLPGSRVQHYWRVAPDGAIELEKIKLWDTNKIGLSDMTLLGTADRRTDAIHSPFFVERKPVDVAEILRRIPHLDRVPGDASAMLTYDEAILIAEKSGCRLPTLAELQASLPTVIDAGVEHPVWSNRLASLRPLETTSDSNPQMASRHLVLYDNADSVPRAFDRHDRGKLVRVRSRWPRNSLDRLSGNDAQKRHALKSKGIGQMAASRATPDAVRN